MGAGKSGSLKVAVIGAGAVGGLVGGLLAEAGEDVTLIGRAAHVERIRERGLRLRGVVGERVVRVDAAESLEERPDLAVFAMKTQDLAAACREAAPVIGRNPVVTMQNGLRCDRIARRFFDPAQVVGCVVYSMATFLEPGEIECGVRGWLTIGDAFSPRPSRLREIKRTLEKALPVRISRDIAASRRTKLVTNLNNALPAVTGRPLQEVYFSDQTSALPLRLMREGLETLSAAGLGIDRSPQALAMRLAARLPESVPAALFKAASKTRLGGTPMFGSTWQSVMRGSPTEVDYLNGEILALGERIGHPTPYNARVVRLVHEVEESGRFRSLEELWPA